MAKITKRHKCPVPGCERLILASCEYTHYMAHVRLGEMRAVRVVPDPEPGAELLVREETVRFEVVYA